MKKVVKSIVASLAVCALTAVFALASVKKDTVTLPSDMMVNGTLVKKGTYTVTFDAGTNELTILKNKEVIAKATGRIEKREGKSRYTVLNSAEKDNNQVLESVIFAGDNNSIVLGDAKGASPAN
jgi:hypothetical protein